MDRSSLAHCKWECQYHIVFIFDKHPELGSKWDRSFWARGDYAATVGNVNEETVKEYIRRQTEESMNEEKKTYRPL